MYLEQMRKTALRRQIRKTIMLLQSEESIRKVAQYASRVWVEETGGELIIQDKEGE